MSEFDERLKKFFPDYKRDTEKEREALKALTEDLKSKLFTYPKEERDILWSMIKFQERLMAMIDAGLGDEDIANMPEHQRQWEEYKINLQKAFDKRDPRQ